MSYVLEGKKIPNVVFKVRVPSFEATQQGTCAVEIWEDVKSRDLFKRKRAILFALPGAFTPTCSTKQLPGYDRMFDTFKGYGIKEVYCLSVNDSFVMNAWAKEQGVKNVKMIPDGTGAFTKKMKMAVKKDNLGFGVRSWRYAAVIRNSVIEKMFVEPGFADNFESDPYGESSPDNVLAWLKKNP